MRLTWPSAAHDGAARAKSTTAMCASSSERDGDGDDTHHIHPRTTADRARETPTLSVIDILQFRPRSGVTPAPTLEAVGGTRRHTQQLPTLPHCIPSHLLLLPPRLRDLATQNADNDPLAPTISHDPLAPHERLDLGLLHASVQRPTSTYLCVYVYVCARAGVCVCTYVRRPGSLHNPPTYARHRQYLARLGHGDGGAVWVMNHSWRCRRTGSS